MRIKGVAYAAQEIEVALPVSRVTLTFRVRPMPYGFDNRLDVAFPPPAPPARRVRTRSGEPVLMYDREDPSYVSKVGQLNTLRALVTLRYALAEDENIEWETPIDDAMPLKELAEKTDKELRAVQFPLADIMVILRAVAEASGITETMLEEKASDFSNPGTHSNCGKDYPSPQNET